jgi:hypothetical protein
MKVVTPITITTNEYIAESDPSLLPGYDNSADYAEWNIATPYTVGQRVIVAALFSQFECVANDTGTAPTLTGVTPWIRVGATNAWKLFDGAANSPTVGYTSGPAGNFTYHMSFYLWKLGRFDTVCVLNTSASRVSVLFTTDNFATIDYTREIVAVDTTPIIDAWTYCFEECNVQKDFLFDGIDGWGSTTDQVLLISVVNDEETITVTTGEVVIGQSREIGTAKADPTQRLVDYSRKDFDAFGNVVFVERAYSYQTTFEVKIDPIRKNIVKGMIEQLRATAAVYYPTADDANNGLIAYGFPTDFEITYSTPDYAYATLQIEGLI